MKIFLGFFLFVYSVSAQSNYILHCDSDLLRASKDSAIAQVGVIERTGRNDGAEIEKYLKSTCTVKGNSYCASAVYWCFFAAAIDLKLRINEIPIKRTALANSIFNDAVLCGEKAKYIPREHSLIVWKYPNSCFGHIERIISIEKAGWVTTVAFNVSGYSSKDKKQVEGVFLKKRNVFHPLGKMRIRGMISFV